MGEVYRGLETWAEEAIESFKLHVMGTCYVSSEQQTASGNVDT